MHRYQPSRGRILLEVFCALAVVASMVGAWQQTHASALLTAAAAAGVLAMVRLFDLGRREPAGAEEPQRIEFQPEVQAEVPAEGCLQVLALLDGEFAVRVGQLEQQRGSRQLHLVVRWTRGGRGRRRRSQALGDEVSERVEHRAPFSLRIRP